MPNPTYTPSELAPEVIKVGDKLHQAIDEISEDNDIFSDISTAIQGKTGQVEPYDKEDIANTISDDLVFPSGTLNISSNGDYDVSAKETAHVAVPGPNLQSKIVTPSISQQSVIPDSGYDGLLGVTVNATPLEVKSVTPTAQQQVVTPTAPNIGFSSVTVGAVPQPTLITKQITANGTYTAADDNADGYSEVEVAVPVPRLQTKQVTPQATQFDVEPSEGFDGLSKVTVKATPLETKTITPTTQQQTVTPVSPNIGFSSVIVEGIQTVDILVERSLTTITTNASSVGDYVFYHYTNLIAVNMPNVTMIGTHAFEGCNNLEINQIPQGITYIGSYGFNECSKLALTSLPSGLTVIEQRTFRLCSRLAITTLPTSITQINMGAFYGCAAIPYIDFSNFTHIPVLENENAFGSTAFPFYFADQTQLDSWKAASNWSALASRFQIKPSGV